MRRELIGANLKLARQKLRLSQTAVAKYLSLSRQVVSATESGKRDMTVQELLALANLYRVPAESFLRPPSPRPRVNLDELQRRANAAGTEKPLDRHDLEEIAAFIEDLKRPGPSGIRAKAASLVASDPSFFRQLNKIANRVRAATDLRTPPINIYKSLSSLGIMVRMSSLNAISGAFIAGTPNRQPGVLINSDQPSDRQRWSAAHELGHFVLGHATSGVEEIISPLGRRFSHKEVEADAFAADLLIPTPLVVEEIKKLPRSEDLAVSVYRLGDRFLVSYQAMVYRLANLNVITPTQKEALLGVRPSAIEARLALKERSRKPFGTAILERILTSSSTRDLLGTPDGVRQLQELAFEEYAREVPEGERVDSAGGVYEKVALWVAKNQPIAA